MFHCVHSIIKVLNATSRSDACKSCGVLAKDRNNKTLFLVLMPRVECFLQDTIAFSDSIKDSDQVCYACYNFFFNLDAEVRCMHAVQ